MDHNFGVVHPPFAHNSHRGGGQVSTYQWQSAITSRSKRWRIIHTRNCKSCGRLTDLQHLQELATLRDFVDSLEASANVNDHHCSLVSVAIVFCNLWLYVPSNHTGSRNDTHKCIITFRFENFLLSTNRRDLICYRALDDVCFNING
ncbi:hypothetical protein R1flu_009431 [Riccia fluitans]|uniref:Uncharacterized protein n=1 Tax=Riccia fluitans TaxID=41844 RepID=A0ABD1Z375_9MARC